MGLGCIRNAWDRMVAAAPNHPPRHHLFSLEPRGRVWTLFLFSDMEPDKVLVNPAHYHTSMQLILRSVVDLLYCVLCSVQSGMVG